MHWLVSLGVLLVSGGLVVLLTCTDDLPTVAAPPEPKFETPGTAASKQVDSATRGTRDLGARTARPGSLQYPEITGRIVDITGRPVVGASVLSRDDASEFSNVAMSRDDGTFAVMCDTIRPRTLLFEAGGFSPGVRERALPGDYLAVTLLQGRAISGRVVDAQSGIPIIGARVLALALGATVGAQVETGTKGAFSLHSRTGPLEIRVTAEGYGAYSRVLGADATSLDIALDRRTGVDLQSWFRVTDDVTGEPVEGVTFRPGPFEAFGDGVYRATRSETAPTREHTGGSSAHAVAPGYLGTESYFQRPAGDHRESPVVMKLCRAGGLTGRVVDSHGRAIGSANVTLTPIGLRCTHPSLINRSSITDEAGRFEDRGLHGNVAYRVEVLSPQVIPTTRDGIRVTAGVNLDLGDVECASGTQVAGEVQYENGTPAAGARVEWRSSTYKIDAVTTASADGSFELAHVGTEGSIVIVSPSYAPWVSTIHDCISGPNRIVLRHGESIRGRVTDAAGGGLVGVRVECGIRFTADGSMPENGYAVDHATHTDVQGQYILDGLLPGTYVVTAGDPVDDRESVIDREASAGSVDVDFILRKYGTIVGTILGMRDRRPATGVIVRSTGGRKTSVISINEVDGSFSMPAEPEANYSFEVTAPGFGWTEMAGITAGEGEVRNIEFLLPDADVIDGIVVWDDGAPAAGLVVGHDGRQLRPSASVTDSLGRFRFEGSVRDAYFRITVSQTGSDALGLARDPIRIEPSFLEVKPNLPKEIRIVAQRPGTLVEGSVTFHIPPGTRVSWAALEFVDPNSMTGNDATRGCAIDSGTFRQYSLPGGEYALRIKARLETPTGQVERTVQPVPAALEVKNEARVTLNLEATL